MIRPRTALAAAVSGLASKVRAPTPCRPSKLRLLVLTEYWPGGNRVAVHAEAHGAAGLAPLGAGRRENLGEPGRLGLALDLLRAGHDEQVHAGAPPCVP